MARPTWDETWMDMAIVIGMRSQCDRAQVGAVIVTADNKVDSIAYNGPIGRLNLEGTCNEWCPRAAGTNLSADYSTCSTIHAEANALIRADHAHIQGGTIYVSRAMCVNCAKLVCNSGLTRVAQRVIREDSHRNPEAVESLVESAGLTVTRMFS